MSLNNKLLNATKWSSVTEIIAKLVTPISNMILARILTPQAFGIVATATMIFSFADMFTDSGFQKYLVQHKFDDEKHFEKSITVAFWTNIFLSIFFWILISIFSEQLAVLVGNSGMGMVFVISCVSLPLTAFSSIQMALYRRKLDFKSLFYVRIIAILVPFVVTIPLALVTKSFWSLIIGAICGNLVNAIILTVKSPWKPKIYYSFSVLKEMLSFSLWSLMESLTIWLTNYIGVFIVGVYLTDYYIGLYKTSMNTVNQIMALVTLSTTPVLFSGLSKVQNDKEKFNSLFYEFQRNVGLLIVPIGVGIFVYQDFITEILLGKQWSETAGFIGLWGLVNSIKIVLSNYCFEVYRAKGNPKISVAVQISQIIILIPTLLYGANEDFVTLYTIRCLVSLEMVIVNLITVKAVYKISCLKMIENCLIELFASICIVPIAYISHQISTSFVCNCVSILICVIVYFVVIIIMPWSRKWFIPYVKKFLGNKRIKV